MLVELVRTDAVATLTLNRPEALNALTDPLKDELLTALLDVAVDRSVRAVVLTGAGRGFCAGQDLREHSERLQSGSAAALNTVERYYNPIAAAITGMPKPVVAAVNGIAAGAGAALAFACDLRLVSDAAGFHLSFAQAGLAADTGASWTLPRLVGHGRAVDLLLRPRTVAAAEALAIGLATEVVPAAELADRAALVAAELAAGPTAAYAGLKEQLRSAAASDLAGALAVEARIQQEVGATGDHARAVAAFLAKERPAFHGD